MQPIFLKGTVEERIPTVEELKDAVERAQERLAAGDRGGAYLELYQVSGMRQRSGQANKA